MIRPGHVPRVAADDWRRCAEAGLSSADAAFLLRSTVNAACKAATRLGIAFAPYRGVRRRLTRREREDYDLALRKKFRRDEALELIGRRDLKEKSA